MSIPDLESAGPVLTSLEFSQIRPSSRSVPSALNEREADFPSLCPSRSLDSSPNSFHCYSSLSFQCSLLVSSSPTPPWPVVSAPSALTLPTSPHPEAGCRVCLPLLCGSGSALRTFAPSIRAPRPSPPLIERWFLGRTMSVVPRRQSYLYPAGTRRIAVVRIEAPGAIAEGMEPFAAEAILDVAGDPAIAALQIDFDARRSQQEFYTALLRDLRRRMPRSLPLSITALASLVQLGRLDRGASCGEELCRCYSVWSPADALPGPEFPNSVSASRCASPAPASPRASPHGQSGRQARLCLCRRRMA